jgi:nucleoside triphosphate diphosphatase
MLDNVDKTGHELTPSGDIQRLLEIMRALRDPVGGCPWDIRQDFRSIAPYTIEEAYEVADAIERNALDDVCDELGDLLLQVVFHAQMAAEIEAFDFTDVVLAITSKMIRRHPHVFGDKSAADADSAKASWDEIKALEKAARRPPIASLQAPGATAGWLDDVPVSLPSLTRALKLQQRAAKVGFDWKHAEPILAKIEEELGELKAARELGTPEAVQEEFGDVLFSLVNLGRHLGIDPEAALRETNGKFRRRFGHIERSLASSGRRVQDATLSEMEALWQEAKRFAKS